MHLSLDVTFLLPGIYHVYIFECVHKGIYPRMSTATLFVIKELEGPSVKDKSNILLNPCSGLAHSHSKEQSSFSYIDIEKSSIMLI